jgi:hypothetical protein
MSMPEEPGGQPSELQQRQPTRQLLLAQALELCIQAERREPGSAQTVIAQQPAWARGDLTRLVALAGSLDAVGSNAVMSDAFRGAARSRLMARIGGDASASVWPAAASRLTSLPPRAIPPRTGHRRKALLWRTSAGLLAAVLSVTATLTASASALPGEPLYGLKQAQEELGVRLAADDKARALALLRTADARLDETSRLLAQGRTGEAVQATQRYDQVVERATTTFVVTVEGAASDPPVAVHMDTRLSQQQEQLQALLQTAPEPARADLREALVATERGRALVADPRAVERALGRASGRRNATSGVAPTPAAEEMATLVPTRGPLVVAQAAATAQPTVVVAEADEHRGGSPAVAQTGDVRRADASDGERDAGTPVRLANSNGTGTGTGNGTAGRGTASGTARPTNAGPGLAGGQGDASPQRGRDGGDDNESDRAAQHGDDIHVAPAQPVVARDEPVAVRPGFGGASVTTSNGRTTGGDDATGGQANRGTGTGTGTAQRDDTAQVQRGSGEDTARAPQQGTVRQVATPVVVAQADNRAPGTGAAGSGGAAGTTAGAAGTSGRGGEQPARAAGPAQATTNGGATNDRTTNRDDSEARSPTASATQSTATRPQPTATPTPQRRNTDSASSAQPTRTPTPTETTRSGDTSKPAATPTRTRTPEPPRGGPD